jgi:prepilin-type N-terminal cleavage/methylation domain-containing protein
MPNYVATPTKHAFSLVELAIVLVVLGLLVGGVLAGKSLIRASELRAITTEKETFFTATLSFRDKYFQLPGDLTNAYQLWGAPCGANSSTNTGCQGNGDGRFDAEFTGDDRKVFKHLSLSKLIAGTYSDTGSYVDTGYTSLDRSNSPASRFPNGFWAAQLARDQVSWAVLGNVFTIGGINPAFDSTVISPDFGFSLKRSEAMQIDKKVDDGKASSGKVLGDQTSSCSEPFGQGDYSADVSLGGNPEATDCLLSFLLP